MASHSNSSLVKWLKFDGTAGNLPTIPSCIALDTRNGSFADVSCAKVCNDSASLFWDQPVNLVNCGLWTSLASASSVLDVNNALVQNDNSTSKELLQHFESVNLTQETFQYATSYASVISNCMEVIYLNVKEFSFSDNGQVPSACTREQLFPFGSNDNSTKYSTDALGDCIDLICSPLTLNPDLAGIGVSFIADTSPHSGNSCLPRFSLRS